jgi:hypothetical protein
MNERIKQLAEQATTKISFRLDPTTYKHIDDPEGDFERVEFDKEKFAELIVRDCMDAVDGYTIPRTFTTHYDAVEQIEALFGIKHNGVEE